MKGEARTAAHGGPPLGPPEGEDTRGLSSKLPYSDTEKLISKYIFNITN